MDAAGLAAEAILAVLLMMVLINLQWLSRRAKASEEALARVSGQLQEAARNQTHLRNSVALLHESIHARTDELSDQRLRLEKCMRDSMRHIEGVFGAPAAASSRTPLQRTAPCDRAVSRTSTAPALMSTPETGENGPDHRLRQVATMAKSVDEQEWFENEYQATYGPPDTPLPMALRTTSRQNFRSLPDVRPDGNDLVGRGRTGFRKFKSSGDVIESVRRR